MPLLETVTRNLNLVKKNTKAKQAVVMFIFTNPDIKNANIRITVSMWLGIPLNKYLESDGTMVIHEKIAIVITRIVFLSL